MNFNIIDKLQTFIPGSIKSSLVYPATLQIDSAQKESRFPTGRISLHCNCVDECGQIISTVLCLQWL